MVTRIFDQKLYDTSQLYILRLAEWWESDNAEKFVKQRGKKFGLINDLDPTLYDADQMVYVSVGRGDYPIWGNVDDLNPACFDGGEFERVSLERGNS